MNKQNSDNPHLGTNKTISDIMNSSNLEFTAKYETAKDKIKLTIDDKKKKVNILLGNRQFLNIND